MRRDGKGGANLEVHRAEDERKKVHTSGREQQVPTGRPLPHVVDPSANRKMSAGV